MVATFGVSMAFSYSSETAENDFGNDTDKSRYKGRAKSIGYKFLKWICNLVRP